MDKVRFAVILDRPFYHAGQIIEGTVVCEPYHPIQIDCVQGRIHGEAVYQISKDHQSCSKNRVLVDEGVELWRYCSLEGMLGMEMINDENHDPQNSRSSKISTITRFPIRIKIPHFAPPSFQCAGSPINVHFLLEIGLYRDGRIVSSHEEPIIILGYQSIRKLAGSKPISINETFHFAKERSIFLEVILNTDVFSTTDRIDACVNISNNWKMSLKYVHLNIVKRISALDPKNQIMESVKIDTTGVGIPCGKRKIEIGESYSFHPIFNIPALPPNIHVDGLFQTDYSLKIAVGRAHNFILATIEVPITITTYDANEEHRRCFEDVLVDLSSTTTNLIWE